MRNEYLITGYPNFFYSNKAVDIYNKSINAMFDKIEEGKDLTIAMKIKRGLLLIYLTCLDCFWYKSEKSKYQKRVIMFEFLNKLKETDFYKNVVDKIFIDKNESGEIAYFSAKTDYTSKDEHELYPLKMEYEILFTDIIALSPEETENLAEIDF